MGLEDLEGNLTDILVACAQVIIDRKTVCFI